MESIPSAVKIGHATLGAGEAPKHTDPEHRDCAYYPTVEPVLCPHGAEAMGAFYSEDFVRELRTTSHELISLLDKLQSQAHFEGPHRAAMFDPIFPSDMRRLRNVTDLLRLLTK